jgi:transposase-like protein
MFGSDFPSDLPSFEKKFGSDDACREYLFQLKWPNGFVCPSCGHTKYWLTAKHRYQCAACEHQASVTVGTVMENSKKPLSLWFKAIFLAAFQKSGINAVNLRNMLGFGSYQTAWTWLHKIRRSMVCEDREKLGVKIKTVETDEAYIGGVKPGKAGRGAEGKQAVAVAVETVAPRGMGRVRIEVVQNCGSAALGAFLQNNIEQETTIITDKWPAYTAAALKGFIHKAVESTKNALSCVHIVISLFKRWLLGTHQAGTSPKYLQNYADEFVFRFNRRKSKNRLKVFARLLEQAASTPATTYRDITGNKGKERQT